MEASFFILLGSAILVGFIHTIIGPDHYLPFVALAKAKKWSVKKTYVVTLICGVGHVLGSVFLALLGAYFGLAIFSLENIEAARGDVSAWLLFIFGFTYLAWALWNIKRSKQHSHKHVHNDGVSHVHSHSHKKVHQHVHAMKNKKIVPWALFVIFIFGPCEALIPLVMYGVAQGDVWGVAAIASAFALATLLTMLLLVSMLLYGASYIRMPRFEKYAHVITGLVLFLCGFGMIFLGL